MRRHLGAPLVGALAVVVVSAGAAIFVARDAVTARERRFETAVTATEEMVRDRLQAQIALLHGGAGLFAAAPGLTCGQFADFVRRMELDEHYPGTLGVGFSVRVEPGALDAYERETGLRVWPSTPREEFHTIRCLEPRDARNRAALGYDMFTEPLRREAMARARDSGTAALSGRVELVQEITENKQPGFLLYTPVYEDGTVPRDVESRRRSLRGFVYSPLRSGDFLSTTLDEVAGRIHLEIYDGATTSPETFLYGDTKPASPRAPVIVRAIDVGGHRWTVRYQALPSEQEARGRAIAAGVLAAGLVFALLLGRALTREQRGAERLASIMDAVPALVSFIDRDERYLVVNRRYEEWFARPRAAIEGRTAREVLGPHAYDRVAGALRSALSGHAASAEADLRLPDGAQRFVLATYTPHFDGRGGVQGAIALVADITDLKKAQLALEASEENLRAILNTSLDAVVQMDAAGLVVFWNPRAEEIFGWPDNEARGRPVAELIVPAALRERHRRGLAHLLETGEGPILGRRIEVPATDRTGREFPVELTVTAIGEGERLLFNAFISDQSDRKHSEAARAFLTEATVALSSSLERDLVRALIPKLAVPYLAAGAALVTFDGSGTNAFASADGTISDKEAWMWAARLAARPAGDGTDRPAESETPGRTVLPLSAGSHAFGALVLSGEAVTPGRADEDRIVAEEYARRAAMALHNAQLYEQAQTANRVKDEFLSTLSHELRTPANAILGWAQMAKESALKGADVSRAIDAVLRNARAQNDLISDILDAERLTAGKVRLNAAPVDLDRVLAAAVDTVKPTALAKRVDVVLDTNNAGCTITGDEERLQQIFWNLLSNAVKFTPPGGVVEVACGRGESMVTVEVRDSGPGIPPEFLPFIFERFRQADASATKSHSGLGLGLAIARNLTELHGGTIEAGNRTDGPTGARMLVRLPAHDAGA